MKSIPLPSTALEPQPYVGLSAAEVLAKRRQHLGPGLFLYYREPLMLVEGKMQYVWDETGRRYLDAIGGIATVSVGHSHPSVVAAAQQQNELLQHATTVYLHPNIVRYAEHLTSKLPGDLKVCTFVNSGSEANDLALLMARAYTGNFDVIALRNGYHGGNASGMAVTSHGRWKFNVPHNFGVHHALAPHPYRGARAYHETDAAAYYAADVQSLIDHATSGRVAAFIAESIQGVGGFVSYPPGYLRQVYDSVRAAGGLCVADEVQCGFGRCGSHFWGFETHGVVPDIVTLAKGIADGFPCGAVVTTPAIAATLAQKAHFNTFGGNPVAMAVADATLTVIEREQLQQNSLRLGQRLLAGLEKLKATCPALGDVRGFGLMLALEFVQDRETKTPAPDTCSAVVERLRKLGLLVGKGGLWSQVIRLTPPMCLTEADADFILAALEEALRDAAG